MALLSTAPSVCSTSAGGPSRAFTAMIARHAQAVRMGSVGQGSSFLFGTPTMGCKRVTICGGRKLGGASLRRAHVACTDSTEALSQPKRKHKSKVDGPTKSEVRLLKALQEFIASSDLPPNKVPTTAELAKSGRQDLANQVRRRGYKLVAQLLEQVHIGETAENTASEDVIATDSVVSKTCESDGSGLPLAALDEVFSKDIKDLDDGGSSNGAALKGHFFPAPEAVRDHWGQGEAAGLTLTGEFVQDSIQDTINRDLSVTSQPLDLQQQVTDERDRDSSGEDELGTDEMEDNEDFEVEDEDEDEEADDYNVQFPVTPVLNPESREEIAAHKVALLRARLVKYSDRRSKELKQPNSFQNADNFGESLGMDQGQAHTVVKDKPRATKTLETQQQLEQLKILLHTRELELTEVSRQLEEAKGMLSLARAKGTAELVHAKQLAFEQDIRLQLVEKALSQTKQVHLEWWGEAGRVEVSGSFNGWQQSIIMEPDISSTISKPNGARCPMMWGTYLCLYPGVYEIKFIVDGNWQVDHRREVVMRHSNQNNILRVD